MTSSTATNQRRDAARVFAALATSFGIAFAIVTPPLDPADERHHLARVFALSEGHLSPAGPAAGHRHEVPTSLDALHPPYRYRQRDGRIDSVRSRGAQIVCLHDVDDILVSLRLPLNPDDRERIRRPSTYGPLPYAAAAASVRVGRWLGGSAGSLLYLARFSTLGVWIALVWLALRLTPVKPWTLLVLSLSPMSLFQASVVSADAITNALALLLLALALRAALGEGLRVRGAQAAVLVGATAALGCVKQGLWPLGALLLLIPGARFCSRRQRVASIAVAAVGMAALTIGWAIWLRAAQGDAGARMGAAWPPFDQLTDWLSTLSRYGYRLLAQFVGILGHLDVVLPRWVYTAYPLAAIAIALSERDPSAFGVGRRAAVAGIGIAAAATTLLLLFALSPDPNTARAGMIQGRYFIPFAPFVFVALPGWSWLPRRPFAVLVGAFCSAVLGLACYSVAHHYFVGTVAGS